MFKKTYKYFSDYKLWLSLLIAIIAVALVKDTLIVFFAELSNKYNENAFARASIYLSALVILFLTRDKKFGGFISYKIWLVALIIVVIVTYAKNNTLEYPINTPKECVVYFDNSKTIIKTLEKSKKLIHTKIFMKYIDYLKGMRKIDIMNLTGPDRFLEVRASIKEIREDCIDMNNRDLENNELQNAQRIDDMSYEEFKQAYSRTPMDHDKEIKELFEAKQHMIQRP